MLGLAQSLFNDESNDFDFRVESNGKTHMLFVDGGNDRVGIGTSSPATALHVQALVRKEFELLELEVQTPTTSALDAAAGFTICRCN